MASLREEIESRRTFAIISHPDAGKTTLTEKLLLYGGAIQTAGSVKGKQSAKHAVSDWMDIEKQRGISVTSSVLQFNYCLLYTSDAADERSSVDLGGRRTIKKKKKKKNQKKAKVH